MGITVAVENTVNFKKISEVINQGIINGLWLAANIVHAQAVQTSPIAPVFGGTLRLSHSMQVNEDDLYAEVFIPNDSPAAEYAPIVELTDPPMKPSNSGSRIPWLRPALYENVEKCKELINKEVEKKLK